MKARTIQDFGGKAKAIDYLRLTMVLCFFVAPVICDYFYLSVLTHHFAYVLVVDLDGRVTS